jgi:membrane-associated protein
MDLTALLSESIARYDQGVYLLLFALVFCEIGIAPLFFLPGDPLLFLCGALCAQGALRAALLVPLLALAAWAGSLLAYRLGLRLGQHLESHAYRWLNRELLARGQRFFARWGGPSLLVSPWVAVLRTFAPLAAGVAGMPARAFAWAALGGSLAWSGGLIAAGYWLGRVPLVHEHLGGLVVLGLVLGLGGLALRLLIK